MEFYYNYFSETIRERYNAALLLTKISESEKEICKYLGGLQRGEALTKRGVEICRDNDELIDVRHEALPQAFKTFL